MNPSTDAPLAHDVWYKTMIAMAIVVAFLWFGSGFLVPLAITGLLFILSSALVDRLRQVEVFGIPLPGWLAHLLSASLVLGCIMIFGVIVSNSADEVQEALPRYQERLSVIAEEIEALLGPRLVTTVQGAIADMDLGALASSLASSLGGALSTFGLVALYLAFLISERSAWVAKLPRLAKTAQGTERARNVLVRISEGVKQYMWVNAVTSAMSGVVAFLIFSWVGLDFAPLLAVLVFAVGFIPNIGAFIGIAMPSLVALIQFDTITPFLIVLFGYGLADQFIANVVQPAMQGKSLNLSTFMVMVSLTFWTTVWGGIGAFLAVPMMVVAMVVFAEIPGARWIAVLLSGNGLLQADEPEAAGISDSHHKTPSTESWRPGRGRKAELEAEIDQLRADFESRDDERRS